MRIIQKLLLLIFLLIPTVFVNGQIGYMGPNVDGHVYAYHGITFDCKSFHYHGELADIYDDNRYIRELFFREGMYKKIAFYINEIPITEEAYIQLELGKRDLLIDDNYSTFDYFNDSTVRINLYAKLSIPICINGVEYDYQDTIPMEILHSENLCFRRERHLFKKDRIIIYIKEY